MSNCTTSKVYIHNEYTSKARIHPVASLNLELHIICMVPLFTSTIVDHHLIESIVLGSSNMLTEQKIAARRHDHGSNSTLTWNEKRKLQSSDT